jgi:hypothetical protein
MSRFSDRKEAPPEVPIGTIVNGAFECHICGVIVTVAVHNRKEEILYWTCPDGHASSIGWKG